MDVIEIGKTSWHYRYLSGDSFWSPPWNKSQIPENICQYFWKLTFLLATTPFGLLLFVFSIVISFTLIGLGWFFGYWPKRYREDHGKNTITIELFPLPYKYDGRKHHRFAPWEIVLPSAALSGLVLWAVQSPATLLSAGKLAGIVIGIIIGFVLLVFLLVKGWKSNTFQLAIQYLKARKKKMCPTLKFID